MLFCVRACLMLTFLAANFMNVATDTDSGTTVNVNGPDTPDSSDITADFWRLFGDLTTDKFIATTMVTMARMFVDSCMRWPARIRDECSLSVACFRAKLIGELDRADSTAVANRSTRALQWLRVMRSKHPNSLGGKRLYVRFEALLALFDKMSGAVSASSSALSNAITDDGGNGGTTVKCEDRLLARQWTEYEKDYELCSRAFVESLLDRSTTTSRPSVSIERFIVGTDTTYRGLDDDAFVATATADGAKARMDEVDLLGTDLAKMFLFAVLSLARYAPPGAKVYNEAISNDDPSFTSEDVHDESQHVLLVHIASHLFRSKITIHQTRELFDHIIDIWRSCVGIVTMEQLCQFLVTLYRMFQQNEATAVDPSQS